MGLSSPWCQNKTPHTTSQTPPPSPSPSADTVSVSSFCSDVVFSDFHSYSPPLLRDTPQKKQIAFSILNRKVCLSIEPASIFPFKKDSRWRSRLDFKKPPSLMSRRCFLSDDFVLFSEHFWCWCE